MKRACVIGWPVAHSRSPVIHRYWLKLYGLDGAYEMEAVRPEEIGDFLHSLGERGYTGANVTLPHKEAALAAADRPDQAATAIGAANTLWLDANGLLNARRSGIQPCARNGAPERSCGRGRRASRGRARPCPECASCPSARSRGGSRPCPCPSASARTRSGRDVPDTRISR